MKRLTFDEQINDIDDFLKGKSVLILLTLILTYLVAKVSIENLTYWGKMGIATSFVLAVFLFLLLLIPMVKRIWTYDFDLKELSLEKLFNAIKRTNFVMLFLVSLFSMFIFYFSMDFLTQYPFEIAYTATMTVMPIFIIPIQLISIFIPLILLKFIILKSYTEKDWKVKAFWHLIPGALFGIAIPLIAFLINRIFVLSLPVLFFGVIGWILIIDYVIQIIKSKMNKKQIIE